MTSKSDGCFAMVDSIKVAGKPSHDEKNRNFCDKCECERKFNYYDGCLGYESYVCSVCGWDINDSDVSRCLKCGEVIKCVRCLLDKEKVCDSCRDKIEFKNNQEFYKSREEKNEKV